MFKNIPPKRVRKESDIYDAVLDVCKQDNFMVYRAIPPTMASACSEFVDRFDELEASAGGASKGWTSNDGSLEEQIYKAGSSIAAE